MQHLDLKEETFYCPVCHQKTLTGYTFDLKVEQVEYDHHFLPRPRSTGEPDAKYLVNNLTLFNNFFCPNDLYVYSGRIIWRKKRQHFDDNVSYNLRRYIRPEIPSLMGNRIYYFISILISNGFNIPDLLLKDDQIPHYKEINKELGALLRACGKKPIVPKLIHRPYEHLIVELKYNPLAPIMKDFYRNPIFMLALLELQLGDTLYLVKRSQDRKTGPPSFGELYRTLEWFHEALMQDRAMNTDLISDLMFQALRMSHFLLENDSRQDLLYRTAYLCSQYITRINLRIGADLNQKLDTLDSNADILFYLHLRLSRELGIKIPMEDSLYRFLGRRLDSVQGYHRTLESTESSRKIAHIGYYLKTHFEKFGQEFNLSHE